MESSKLQKCNNFYMLGSQGGSFGNSKEERDSKKPKFYKRSMIAEGLGKGESNQNIFPGEDIFRNKTMANVQF